MSLSSELKLSIWQVVHMQYFESSNMIGRGIDSQLQMDQSAAMYSLKSSCVASAHICNSLGIVVRILELSEASVFKKWPYHLSPIGIIKSYLIQAPPYCCI